MATPSQVDALLDDASLGRLTVDEALTELEKLAELMIRAGHRMRAHCTAARVGVGETTVALAEIRRLSPTVRGRRSDLTDQVAPLEPVAA